MLPTGTVSGEPGNFKGTMDTNFCFARGAIYKKDRNFERRDGLV